MLPNEFVKKKKNDWTTLPTFSNNPMKFCHMTFLSFWMSSNRVQHDCIKNQTQTVPKKKNEIQTVQKHVRIQTQRESQKFIDALLLIDKQKIVMTGLFDKQAAIYTGCKAYLSKSGTHLQSFFCLGRRHWQWPSSCS